MSSGCAVARTAVCFGGKTGGARGQNRQAITELMGESGGCSGSGSADKSCSGSDEGRVSEVRRCLRGQMRVVSSDVHFQPRV